MRIHFDELTCETNLGHLDTTSRDYSGQLQTVHDILDNFATFADYEPEGLMYDAVLTFEIVRKNNHGMLLCYLKRLMMTERYGSYGCPHTSIGILPDGVDEDGDEIGFNRYFIVDSNGWFIDDPIRDGVDYHNDLDMSLLHTIITEDSWK